MKIQGVSNSQNNVTHKAYFKPNAEFKKLWAANSPLKGEAYIDKMLKVRNTLPNHEIEIIDSGIATFDEKINNYYLLFNNFTKKSFGIAIAVNSVRNHLETVFECLLEKDEKTKNFFNKEDKNYMDFEDLTTCRGLHE